MLESTPEPPEIVTVRLDGRFAFLVNNVPSSRSSSATVKQNDQFCVRATIGKQRNTGTLKRGSTSPKAGFILGPNLVPESSRLGRLGKPVEGSTFAKQQPRPSCQHSMLERQAARSSSSKRKRSETHR